MADGENTLDRLCELARIRSTLKRGYEEAFKSRNLSLDCSAVGQQVVSVTSCLSGSSSLQSLGAAAFDGILAHLHDRLAEVEGLLIDCARNLEIPE